jgi:hypothetical protein
MKSEWARIVLICLLGIPALTALAVVLDFFYMAGWLFSLVVFGLIGYAVALMWALDNLML